MKPEVRIPLIIALLAHGAYGFAQEPPVSGEPLVVRGTRLTDERARATLRATVIEREEIESQHGFSLVEILRRIAGVHVIEQGGRGGFSSVLVRGGEPNFTAVFIDGVQVNDSTNTRGGSFDFSTLSADDIERIEIIRGPQSAVYGSDSLAGVINIVTRRDTSNAELGADIAIGTDGYWHGAATASLPFGKHGVRAVLYSEDDGDPVEGSRFDSVGGRLAASFVLADATKLFVDVSAVDADAESFPEDSGGPRLAVIREVETRQIDERHYRVALTHSWDPGMNVTINASRYERDEASDAPGIAPGVIDGIPPLVTDTDFERDTVSVVMRIDRGTKVSGAFGIELRREQGDSTGTIDFGVLIPTDFGIDRDIKSVFAEANIAPHPDWSVNLGLRHDDSDDASSETTPRVAARYRWGDSGVSLYANWGEAFKLPSFFALAFPLLANPDLLPERSQSSSVGMALTDPDSGLSIDIEVFRNTFRDLIDFEPALFTNVNRSKVVTKGVEISQSYTTRDGGLTLSSFASYLEADLLGSDQRLRGRPHLRAGVSTDWQANDKICMQAAVWYTDSVFESSIPTGFVELGSFVRADLSADYRASDRLTWYAGVQNLFDRDYEQAVGFPAPGRRLQVGVRVAK